MWVGSVSSWATGIHLISKCEGTASYSPTGPHCIIEYTPNPDLRALLAPCLMLARAGRPSVRLRSTTAAPSKSVSTPLLNIVLHEPQIPGNTGTAARPKLPRSPCGPPRSASPLACSGLLWRPWQLTVPPIRRVSPRYYWQAGSRHALPTAPRRATWLLTGRGKVQARRPPAELAPRRALHLHLNPGVRASTTGR